MTKGMSWKLLADQDLVFTFTEDLYQWQKK